MLMNVGETCGIMILIITDNFGLVLIMRERCISGMMADQHRVSTEKEGKIAQLTKVHILDYFVKNH